MKKYLPLHYHTDLIKLYGSLSDKSAFAALLSSLFILVVFYNHLPMEILVTWFGFSLLYIVFKLLVVGRLLANIDDPKKRDYYIKLLIAVTLFSGLLWGSLSWVVVIFAETSYSFLILGILFGLMSGAISTFSPLFVVYVAYCTPMIIMLFSSFLYASDDVRTYIAMMLLLFIYIIISASYRMYRSLEQAIILKDMVEASQRELEEINLSLESRIDEAVQKSRDQELRMLQQSRLAQMGEMISMIAHQWRQPLSAIASTAASLQLKIGLERYDKRYFSDNIEKISQFSQHLSNTIDDFRHFFKSNKNEEEFFMCEVAKGSLTIIGTSLENKNIIVSTSYNSAHTVLSYFNELKQVCLNLIKNAEDILLLKKVANPTINIRTYSDATHVYLEVSDNAGGVDEAIIDKIFDPYFTTKERYDGTGLGLYMSKTIIEEHCSGRLSVANNERGAVFTIALEAHSQTDDSLEHESEADRPEPR